MKRRMLPEPKDTSGTTENLSDYPLTQREIINLLEQP
jgi:hypothetical protein